MASIYRNGQRWRAAVVMPTGRRLTRTFDTKADAAAWARARETEIDHGTWGTAVNRKVTLAEYAPQWLAAQRWRTNTRDRNERSVALHVLPAFGDQPMVSITNTQIQGWIAELERTGSAPRSIRGYYRTLSTMLAAAVADGILARNPATVRRIRLPQPDDTALTVLTLEQLQALAAAVPSPWRAFLWCGAAAGLRPGETAGLTVTAVDFDTEEIRVERQMTTTSDGVVFAAPKSRSSTRTVPLPAPLADHLRTHMAAHPPVGFDGHDLVFSHDGEPLRRSRVARVWDTARRKVGLDPAAHRGFHDLRHFYASALIAGGASVKTVQTLLGHASAVETLDCYAHLWPDSDITARQAITDALGH